MRSISNLVRPAVFTIAALIVTLSAISVQRGFAAVQKVPNESIVTYKLKAGASMSIAPPASDKCIFVTGCNTTDGDRGVGHVAMLYVPSTFIEWAGINSAASGTITQGFSGTAGTQIVQIDYGGLVNLKVASTTKFEVVNSATSTQTGSVTMIY